MRTDAPAPRLMARVGLAEKIVRIHRAFDRARVPHAFGAALALAYYATPRTTIDVDVNVFVSTDRYKDVVAALRRAGVDALPEPEVTRREGQGRGFWGENPIDVFFSYDDMHEAMRSAVRTVPFGETTIPILAPEHLIVAKAAFDRAKDWIDIEEMLIALDDLDEQELRTWLLHLVGADDARAKRLMSLMAELRDAE